jgi:mono/diheme cytochrome c family protein
MRPSKPDLWGSFAIALAALATASCTAPGGPDRITAATWPTTPVMTDGGVDMAPPIQTGPLTCRAPHASEVMVARSTIATGESRAPTKPTYFTADLFGKFKAVCGGCHVESSLGNYGVSPSTFAMKVDQHTIDVIKSTDANVYMPPKGTPNGMVYGDRVASDPVVQLVELLSLWIAQGRPTEKFDLPAPDGASTVAGYSLSPELASALTNIGTCVPDKGMVGTSTPQMDELDAMFAAATTLPETLDKTDLFTLESEALARSGTISFAPTYPLWTDGAGKMRYVRVPRGKTIAFDKAKQQFSIPPNTRFYKTFLKSVIDANGNPGFRKIETRVIVARPDENLPDGTAHTTALYGTYVWNEDESQATLLTDPLRNGKPFADRIFTYVTDEQKAQPIIDAAPKNLLLALSKAGVTRKYALPGAERCVQCHMGSPSQSFVLGFTPLQMNRRRPGEGGLYETAAGEELTQLQRLIDYGIISGMASPADVLPLEKSQGTRSPRTPEELAAQAYMVGNCSHCHNPRGLPSVKEPAIKDVLNFLPGPGPREGVFEFPLDVVSPIRKRGLYQDIDIAYITPSLFDLPDGGSSKFFCPGTPGGSCQFDITQYPLDDPNNPPPAPPVLKWVLAPWRSLIYRNVDTPYDYFDDYALYPHMPLSSPSYDCRAPKLMGDWMVSIPAILKNPSKPEDAAPRLSDLTFGDKANRDVQPYREVKKDDPGYAAAVDAAKARLKRYHDDGYRYSFCPKTYTDDITDSYIDELVSKNLTVTTHTGPFTDVKDDTKVLMPQITPFSPHFVGFDDTDPPGDWFPRRPDWEKALVNPNISMFVADTVKAQHLKPDEAEDLTNVLEALLTVKLTPEIKAALLEDLPFGLWDTTKAGCSFTGIPTAGSLTGAARPSWMDIRAPAATAPVYYQTPGAAVFTTICFNCHGLKADSKGLLAEEISTLTGGDARVANFRDGLFGPVTQPGMNRARVFGPAAGTLGGGVTADDLASRYLAWMALGGTAKHLPQDVLVQVAQAPVLGNLRQNISPTGTPDMLRLGLQLCSQVATSDEDVPQLPLADLFGTGRIAWSKETGLIDTTGDAEMWLRLCSMGNRPLVRVPLVSNGWSSATTVDDLRISGFRLFWGASATGQDLYGANPAMDAKGNLTTGLAGNTFPICVQKPTSASETIQATQWLTAHKVRGNVVPFCPDGLVAPANQLTATQGEFKDGRKWAARGAINAALAVFLYLDQIERDSTKRKPLYNQCDLLPKP